MFLPRKLFCPRFFKRALKDLCAFDKFAADIDVRQVHVDCA